MRLSKFLRTTSFRLALLFLLLFGAASLTLFGFLYVQTSGYLVSRVDGWLQREREAFSDLSQDGFMARLATRQVADPNLERPFVLFDPAGRHVIGSDLTLPPALLASVPDDRPFDFTFQRGGQKTRYRGLMHRTPSGNRLLIAQDMTMTRRFDELLVWSFLWGGLVTAALGLAGAVIAGLNAVARIDEVARATQQIIAGNLSERLPTRGRSGDLDRLAHVINGMLAETERLMQEVKGVCDNIAHDLRTPVTRLLAGLERSRRRARTTEEYDRAVDEAIVEIKSILKTFAALLRISEVESGARRAGFTTVDLGTVGADVAEFYEPIAEEKGVTLEAIREGDTVPTVAGDPSLLFEAISNLADNALKYSPRGGRVELRSFVKDGSLGIEVSDTGPGIPPDERAAVGRRFYRLEESRHTPGTGLGLALVAAVARLHAMDLTIEDAAPGSRITLSRREGAGRRQDSQSSAPARLSTSCGRPASELRADEIAHSG
ncbi:MAG: HAMP domain-containing protein [Acetobacteraceae bacterium]|nr:HAMP domain-containing protein [Acetobacteraceae bacterium]